MAKRILIGWELGGGLGHLVQIRMLAREFLERGFEVLVAVASPRNGAQIFWSERNRRNFTLLRTPSMGLGLQTSIAAEPPVTFADLLYLRGFGDRHLLAATTAIWRNLLREIKPDLVVSDFSPLLNLAARGLVPLIVVGNGYMIPPNDRPLPPIGPWISEIPLYSQRHEDEILDAVRSLPRPADTSPIARLGELFHGSETFLCTFPEFDPYQQFSRRYYYTPFNIPEFSNPPILAERPSEAVFVYLPGDHPSLPVLLEIFSMLERRCTLYAPGIDSQLKASYARFGHQVLESPADLSDVLMRVGLTVHHAGLAMVHAALFAGVPQLLLPLALEHVVTARGMRQFGACAAFSGVALIDKAKLLEVCHVLLTDADARMTANAASRMAISRTTGTLQVIVDTCCQMM